MRTGRRRRCRRRAGSPGRTRRRSGGRATVGAEAVPGARRRSRRPRGAGPARHRRRARRSHWRSRRRQSTQRRRGVLEPGGRIGGDRRGHGLPPKAHEGRQRGVAGGRRCVAPDERRELGVAGGRLAVGCGGVGSPVGCGVGQVGHQMLMRGRPAPGLVPGSRDIFARARESVMTHKYAVPQECLADTQDEGQRHPERRPHRPIRGRPGTRHRGGPRVSATFKDRHLRDDVPS